MNKPWTSRPQELLVHGLEHLQLETDFDRRMAMICIDNAVEIMLKTYMFLPKGSNNIHALTKKEKEERCRYFPNLIAGFEQYAPEKLNGIDPEDILFFHELRNQLYHAGNGLTVELIHAETYGATARTLFHSLFGITVKLPKQNKHLALLGEFMDDWRNLVLLFESKFKDHVGAERWVPGKYIDWLSENGKLDNSTIKGLRFLHDFRNHLVHGTKPPSVKQLEEATGNLTKMKKQIEEL